PQDAQFTAGRSCRASSVLYIAPARLRRDISDCISLEKVGQSKYRICDARRSRRLWASLFGVIIQHVSYEDRSGITWAFSASSALHPFPESDFSLVAVCRASRALAAATVLSPGDVVA